MNSTSELFVFLCDARTQNEVFQKGLVGTTFPDWQRDFGGLRQGSQILVYDYSKGVAQGTFRITQYGKPLDRGAWGGRFPFQAAFEPTGTSACFDVDRLKRVVPRFMRHNSNKPRAYFSGAEADTLLELFGSRSGERPQEHETDEIPGIFPDAMSDRRYRTPQGFDVKSKAEAGIAGFFYRESIECHYERPLPAGSPFRCDFYLPHYNIYVEYWGAPDQDGYLCRMEEKKRQYRAAGAKLIELLAEDERDLDAALRRELCRFDAFPTALHSVNRSMWERAVALVRRWIQSMGS